MQNFLGDQTNNELIKTQRAISDLNETKQNLKDSIFKEKDHLSNQFET